MTIPDYETVEEAVEIIDRAAHETTSEDPEAAAAAWATLVEMQSDVSEEVFERGLAQHDIEYFVDAVDTGRREHDSNLLGL